MSFTLPKLDYSYDALEPHIDARTMEIHHSKHHQGYTNKLNAAIEGLIEIFEIPANYYGSDESKDILDILKKSKAILDYKSNKLCLTLPFNIF